MPTNKYTFLRERANLCSSLHSPYLGEKVAGEARHHRRLHGGVTGPAADHGAASDEAREVGLVDVERLPCLFLPFLFHPEHARSLHRQEFRRSCWSKVVEIAGISFNLSQTIKSQTFT